MKSRVRTRTHGSVGGRGLLSPTYPIEILMHQKIILNTRISQSLTIGENPYLYVYLLRIIDYFEELLTFSVVDKLSTTEFEPTLTYFFFLTFDNLPKVG